MKLQKHYSTQLPVLASWKRLCYIKFLFQQKSMATANGHLSVIKSRKILKTINKEPYLSGISKILEEMYMCIKSASHQKCITYKNEKM